MNNDKIKNIIRQEFNQLNASNKKEQLLEDITYISQIPATSHKNPIRYIPLLLCTSFVLLFTFITISSSNYYSISLDVNPSIELKIDKSERVSDIVCHNEEGMIVLEEMELKGTDVDVAVNAIIGSMFKNGYISEIKNSVLVTVSGKDKSVREDMKERVVKDIKQTLEQYSLESSVISQDLDDIKKYKKIADKYHISIGKVVLIEQFISKNKQYQFEDLVHLSIDEMNTLIRYSHTHFNSISIEGIESRYGYLSEEQVKEIVINHARVDDKDITYYKIDLISEKSRLLYSIIFKDSYGTYKYKVNAISGTIIDFDIHI